MIERYDVAILGSGFAGSLLSMVARSLGLSVVMIEKGSHPRFAIGESSTPLANLLLEEIADQFNLQKLKSLTKWGVWQREHPNVGCGLKRGFSFYHHVAGESLPREISRKKQLLVAASLNDSIADTHWYRPDFDELLVQLAVQAGTTYSDQTAIQSAEKADNRWALKCNRDGNAFKVNTGFIIDATGPRGCLYHAFGLKEVEFPHMPRTQALFAHFRGVREWAGLHPETELSPFPPDAAALHHVFDGGWIWVLRFNNGIVSVGVAAEDRIAAAFNFAEGAVAWERLLRRYPSIAEQFDGAEPVTPFLHSPRLSFLSGQVVGDNWALAPSASGFVDPLLSTGFPLTLLGILRLGEILKRKAAGCDVSSDLTQYSLKTVDELIRVSRLVGALYRRMSRFEFFSQMTLPYFAAASFTETARRLGKPSLAGSSFLLGDHTKFARGMERLVSSAPSAGIESEVRELIQEVDVAGLGRSDRRNWYPVELDDLFRSSHLLGVGRHEIIEMLERCGFPLPESDPSRK